MLLHNWIRSWGHTFMLNKAWFNFLIHLLSISSSAQLVLGWGENRTLITPYHVLFCFILSNLLNWGGTQIFCLDFLVQRKCRALPYSKHRSLYVILSSCTSYSCLPSYIFFRKYYLCHHYSHYHKYNIITITIITTIMIINPILCQNHFFGSSRNHLWNNSFNGKAFVHLNLTTS